MGFDFRAQLIGDDGEYDEDEVERWDDELLERFEASPEHEAFCEAGGDGDFLGIFLDYARVYFSQMPATMDAHDVVNVLLKTFPRKVSCSPGSAADIVQEQRAFWTFVGREFGAANATACIQALDDRLIGRLGRELSNPANFGMAKSFCTMGEEAGFDLSTEAGFQSWVAAYNGALGGGAVPPPALVFVGAGGPEAGRSSTKTSRAKRAKRKAVRASRRRNRR